MLRPRGHGLCVLANKSDQSCMVGGGEAPPSFRHGDATSKVFGGGRPPSFFVSGTAPRRCDLCEVYNVPFMWSIGPHRGRPHHISGSRPFGPMVRPVYMYGFGFGGEQRWGLPPPCCLSPCPRLCETTPRRLWHAGLVYGRPGLWETTPCGQPAGAAFARLARRLRLRKPFVPL
jgi:hypothetical protein